MALIVSLSVSLIRDVSRAPTIDRCAPERLCRALWDCSRTETGATLPIELSSLVVARVLNRFVALG